MKIVYIVFNFPPSAIGGTEIATLNIAKEMSKNHDVHIITKKTKQFPKLNYDFHIHYVGITSEVHIIELLFFSVGMIIPILKIKPDIIHEQSISPSNIVTILMKKMLHIPYVVWGQGFDVYKDWPLKKIITKITLVQSEVIISLSEDMKDKLLRFHTRKIITIPNGIDLDKFCTTSKKNEILNKLGINKKIILFVGTLKEVKGIVYLIDAMKYITLEFPDSLLLIIGNGPLKSDLQNYVNKCGLNEFILFIDEIPNYSVPKYMAISYVFVLPSLSESFGIVLLEAMASGIPIVASNVGGIPYLIEDGKNGLLVEPRNSVKLSDKIKILLNDNNLRLCISKNNIEKSKNYSWAKITKQLEDIYLNISNRN